MAQSIDVSPIVAQLLLNRGFTDFSEARRFVESPLTDLHAPELLPGISDAVERLHHAIESKHPICIYGDYDADGLTATAILFQLLQRLETKVEFYMPNRLEDGYGLKIEALRQIAANGCKLVVTVDCGITAIDEAIEARRLGLKLIITDHHEPKSVLPAADCVVHPRMPGTNYPFGDLSGSGVALKLAWALCQRISGSEKVSAGFREFLLDAVALASLGLIADVVPLHEENRVLVKHGLYRLRSSPSIGLKALMESAGLSIGRPLTAEDVGFKLAPRINAAGRLGCSRLVVELLTTTNAEKAKALAAYLDGQNKERQSIERKMTSHARDMVDQFDFSKSPALVLASDEWHPGVIGIVAGKLADAYGKPTLLIALRDKKGIGSGRSIPGIALHEALRACDSRLLSHGGHAAAAGFRVAPDQIDALRHDFCDYVAAHFPSGVPAAFLELDVEIPLSSLTPGLLRDLEQLEPYGADNPRPRFLAGGLSIIGEPRRIGGGERHLSFRVGQGRSQFRAVAFGMGDRADELMSAGGQCCLAFTPKWNEWNGNRSIEIEVADFQPGAVANLS